MKIKIDDSRYSAMLMAPASLFVIVFLMFPIARLFYQSLHNIEFLDPSATRFVALAHYAKVFASPRVGNAALKTLLYTVIALGSEFVIGFAAALLFNRLGKRSALLRTIFLFPLMIPPIVAGLLWRFMLISNFGIVNWTLTRMGILSDPNAIAWLGDPSIVLYSVALPNIWITTSFVALVLYTGLQNIPEELIEACRIDGASAFQTFLHVTIPLLRPVIAVVVIIRGIDAARAFDMIWIMTEGGPLSASEVLSLTIYKQMVVYGKIGEASAMAVLFLAGLLIFSLVAIFTIWNPQKRHS